MISDARIPFDRRIVYAFGLLAGLRPGEGAALRWRQLRCDERTTWQADDRARLLATNRSATKRTKTESVRYIPVHPTL
jgi:integrase